jgi:predicted transcriptional regulator
MNAVEQIVEIYFQKILICLTHPDIKVEKGNNRQFDLLAYNIKKKKSYHIESSVKHELRWNPTIDELKELIGFKFFGTLKNKNNKGKNTDKAKNKNYLDQIKSTYEFYGMNYEKINRVWVLWCTDKIADTHFKIIKSKKYLNLNNKTIEIISFRDIIIPELEKSIGKSNYENDIIRTLSLIIESRKQKKIN